MKWIKVRIDYYSENLESQKKALMNMFEEIGIKETEVTDYFSDSPLDYNINFRKENDVWSITGYIIDNRFSNIKLNIIYSSLKEFTEKNEDFIYEIYTSKCSDEDWRDEWKKYFRTVRLTDKIVIKPSWDKYEAVGNEAVIEIDPGMAFGTGTHETTELCVKFLEKYSRNKKKMLDIGCGSGILMLIGKKLGIKETTGIDIDEKVERVVLENFEKNNINAGYRVVIGDLVKDINEKYDLIVANILADVLMELLDDIEKILGDNAKIIFSGIIEEKEKNFIEKAEKKDLTLIDRSEKNKWVSLVFKYKK